MFLDDIDENDLPQIDPTKINFTIEPRFLEREILIRVKVSDDQNFNNLIKGLDEMKVAFDQEIQAAKGNLNATP